MDDDTTDLFVALIDRIAALQAESCLDGLTEREPTALTAAG